MKRNLLLRISVFGFLFLGLAFVANVNSLQAQSSSFKDSGVYSLPQGQFVTPPVAISRLESAQDPVKSNMSTMQPGTQSYREAYAKYVHFNTTLNLIVEGKGVAHSIQEATLLISTDEYGLNRNQLQQYWNDLVSLLRA